MERLKAHMGRFRGKIGEESGTITIEFVIVFPLLVAWFLGSFIYFDAYRSNTLSAKVAFTISDLMARSNQVTPADMALYYDVQERMMPGRISESYLRISSICYREREVAGVTEGEYRLHWSDVHDDYWDSSSGLPENVEKYTDDADIPVALMPLMADGDSVILTEVFAVWTPIAEQISGYMGLERSIWTNRLVERPRFVTVIPHSGENNSNICPLATWDGG